MSSIRISSSTLTNNISCYSNQRTSLSLGPQAIIWSSQSKRMFALNSYFEKQTEICSYISGSDCNFDATSCYGWWKGQDWQDLPCWIYGYVTYFSLLMGCFTFLYLSIWQCVLSDLSKRIYFHFSTLLTDVLISFFDDLFRCCFDS